MMNDDDYLFNGLEFDEDLDELDVEEDMPDFVYEWLDLPVEDM